MASLLNFPSMVDRIPAPTILEHGGSFDMERYHWHLGRQGKKMVVSSHQLTVRQILYCLQACGDYETCISKGLHELEISGICDTLID